jgi:photosystem II stability/assembly factor-like uncharacterized protein
MQALFGGERTKAKRAPAQPIENAVSVPTWQELGPLNLVDRGSPSIYEPSQGRMNAIAMDPANPQHLYAGSASGGVWVTTDGGAKWSPRAQNLPVITISSIVVDPTDGNTVYIATGDADGFVTPSAGVYKSTDAGNTWAVTGLAFQLADFAFITKLSIDPGNGSNLYAATNTGVYYSRNAGKSWTLVSPDSGTGFAPYRDIKLKPGTASTAYTVNDNGAFYRSTDSGVTWKPAAGVPDATTTQRAVIAVTAADPKVVYLLAASTTDLVLYKSSDGGGSFTQVPSTTLSQFATGQATFYDLVLAVSPTNANELMSGVISAYRSTDGGRTWFFTSSGPTGKAYPIVHVDQHDIEYLNGAIYYCSDGGIHRSPDGGATWANLSPTLGVGQIYDVAGSNQNPSLIYVGEQDCGFNRYDGSVWEHRDFGDFSGVAVDPTNDQVVYAAAHGVFNKSTDGYNTSQPLKPTTEPARFFGPPVAINPVNTKVVYAGFQNLYRSADAGGNWTKVSNFTDAAKVQVIGIAPSDPKTIYVARDDENGGSAKFYRTTDEGATFTDVSAGLPFAVTGVAIDPTNPRRIWVSLKGGNTNAVYYSTDGGSKWTNFSGGTLPNSSTRAIVYETGSQDGLYVGTLTGVYYRNAKMNDWQPYNNNLPNVIVDSLKIDDNSKKLRAGTFGRGLWQANVAGATSTKGKLLNISTRLRVLTGENVEIAGFIVTGTDAKKVLVRGLGPSLPTSQNLPDPTLALHDATKTLQTNDDWKDTQQAAIQATTVPPPRDAESALIATVPAGTSKYTAILAGKGSATGIGLVEVYDLAQSANSQLANISTRGFVDSGDNVMIGGVILGPDGSGASRVLLRGIGPSLGGSGVANALADPVLTLKNGNGVTVATNDNWKATQQREIEATKAAPSKDAESAILQTLGPGKYTAILSGKNNGTGVALVEAYNLQ